MLRTLFHKSQLKVLCRVRTRQRCPHGPAGGFIGKVSWGVNENGDLFLEKYEAEMAFPKIGASKGLYMF